MNFGFTVECITNKKMKYLETSKIISSQKTTYCVIPFMLMFRIGKSVDAEVD